jgi:nucleotide-binding universal stress UspA family protein
MDEQVERAAVVVGVDGSRGCAAAVQYAAELASERDLAVRLVHVSPVLLLGDAGEVTSDVAALADGILASARADVLAHAPGVTVTSTHRVGGRASGVAAAAGPEDVVVVGRSRHRGPRWLATGGLAAGVAARRGGAVLVVPEDTPPVGEAPRIVVADQATGAPAPGLGVLFDWAAGHGASVAVVHTWWVPDPYVDLAENRTHAVEHEERSVRAIELTLAPHLAAHPDVPVEIRVRHGRPAHVLIEEARGAELLVLPRHHAHGILPGHVGGTTREVLRECSVPVLLLPAYAESDREDLVLEEAGSLRR